MDAIIASALAALAGLMGVIIGALLNAMANYALEEMEDRHRKHRSGQSGRDSVLPKGICIMHIPSGCGGTREAELPSVRRYGHHDHTFRARQCSGGGVRSCLEGIRMIRIPFGPDHARTALKTGKEAC